LNVSASTANFKTTGSGRFDGGLGIGANPTATYIINVNASSSNPLGLAIDNTGSGDSAHSFLLSGDPKFTFGVDNSDSDKFKISRSGQLGSDDAFEIDASGNFAFNSGNFTGVGTIACGAITGGAYNGVTLSSSSEVKITANAAAHTIGADGYFYLEDNTDGFKVYGGEGTQRILTVTGGDWTIDQDTSSGSAPNLTADNFSDGGSNAIVTTTQEGNWDTHLSSDGSDHTFIDQDVTDGADPSLLVRPGATLVVAANDSATAIKNQADYLCDGTADNVQIASAYAALTVDGVIYLAAGTYTLKAAIKPISNSKLIGAGRATKIIKPAEVTSLLTADTVTSGGHEDHVHVTSSTGFAVGDEVFLWADNLEGWLTEYHTITSIDSNTIYVTPDVDAVYTTAESAYLSNEFPLIRIGKNTGTDACDRTNVIISNMLLDGNASNRTNDDTGEFRNALVDVEATSVKVGGHLFENLWLENNTTDGLGIQLASECKVINCHSSNQSKYGFHVGTGSESISITNCIDNSADQSSFYLCGASKWVTFVNCHAIDAPFGFEVGTDNYYWSFIGCTVDNATNRALRVWSSYEGAFVGCTVFNVNSEALHIVSPSSQIMVTGCTINKNVAGASKSTVIVDGDDCTVTGNYIEHKYSSGTAYAVSLTGDNNVVIGNRIAGDVGSGYVNNAGSGNIVRDNKGFVSENSGTATLLNGNTTVTVAHGCSATPTVINIAWRENPTNAIGDWWVDTIGATNFVLNGVDPGASNLDFGWEAKVR
jgi:hypothetical protein